MRGHFIGSDLRRLHEFVAGGQGRDAVFLSEPVGAVHDVLFHGVYIGIIGRGCGFWLRFRFIGFCLCWRFTGVGLSAFYLHTAVGAVPIDLKSHCLAHIPQLDIVVAVDGVSGHVGFLSIHKDAVGGERRFQRFHSLRRGSAQSKPHHKTA